MSFYESFGGSTPPTPPARRRGRWPRILGESSAPRRPAARGPRQGPPAGRRAAPRRWPGVGGLCAAARPRAAPGALTKAGGRGPCFAGRKATSREKAPLLYTCYTNTKDAHPGDATTPPAFARRDPGRGRSPGSGASPRCPRRTRAEATLRARMRTTLGGRPAARHYEPSAGRAPLTAGRGTGASSRQLSRVPPHSGQRNRSRPGFNSDSLG